MSHRPRGDWRLSVASGGGSQLSTWTCFPFAGLADVDR